MQVSFMADFAIWFYFVFITTVKQDFCDISSNVYFRTSESGRGYL